MSESMGFGRVVGRPPQFILVRGCCLPTEMHALAYNFAYLLAVNAQGLSPVFESVVDFANESA